MRSATGAARLRIIFNSTAAIIGHSRRRTLRIFRKCHCDTPRLKLAPLSAGKPRVGFVVTDGHEGVFLRYLAGVLTRLDREAFDPVIICSAGGELRIRTEIPPESVETFVIPSGFDKIVERIREGRFAVLYHWEIGSDVTNYFLPFFQLAPIQCTGAGLPDTSGISQVDYFLSSEACEPERAEQNYTEQLLRSPSLLTWQRRMASPASSSRAELGIGDYEHLYLCPHKIEKFHPDFDGLLGAILRRDPDGLLVIPKDSQGHAARKLHNRLRVTLPHVIERVRLAPYQSLESYFRLVHTADVLLDPIHYGGGLTSFDGLSLNKPTVTLPGSFLRGRFTFGFYRKMGVPDCIAANADDYVERAVRLGTDREWRGARREPPSRIERHPLRVVRFHRGIRPDLPAACRRGVSQRNVKEGAGSRPASRPQRSQKSHVGCPQTTGGDGRSNFAGAGVGRAVPARRHRAEKQGRIDQAIRLYQRGLALNPVDASAYRCLGTAYKTQKRLDLAAACFRRAVDLCPHFPEAWNNLGNTLAEQRQDVEAAACFERAFTVQPHFAGAHFNFGQTLGRMGRFDEAIVAVRRASDLSPRSAEFYNGLGIACYNAGRIDEAIAAYDRAVSLSIRFCTGAITAATPYCFWEIICAVGRNTSGDGSWRMSRFRDFLSRDGTDPASRTRRFCSTRSRGWGTRFSSFAMCRSSGNILAGSSCGAKGRWCGC